MTTYIHTFVYVTTYVQTFVYVRFVDPQARGVCTQMHYKVFIIKCYTVVYYDCYIRVYMNLYMKSFMNNTH